VGKKRKKGGKRKGSAGIDPWDNLLIRWDTHPDDASLKTDASVNWPFGDGEWMTGLTDAYFAVFLRKAWALCLDEAGRRPGAEQADFLKAQRKRLDGYRDARRKKGKKR